MDPVEKLFRELPSPAADRAALDQDGRPDELRIRRAFESFLPHKSCDPDHKFLTMLVSMKPFETDSLRLLSGLGYLALSKPRILDDGSAKSEQLKYHAWISQGRKDIDNPFEKEKQPEGQRVDLPKQSHAYLPAELVNPEICANCAKPNAKSSCAGCLVKLDDHVVMKTAYCNKACQAQHWEQHKPQCLGRRKVVRAVSLLYDLFVMFQKKAGVKKQIRGVTEKRGIRNILHLDNPVWALQGKPFVCNFQTGTLSEEQELAVLFLFENQQILSICHGLLSLLLLPLCKTLQEVHIMPRNAHRPSCDVRRYMVQNNMYSRHTVLCATLKSGEKMAIDIAGAQFGWRETVAPWGIWASHRVIGKPYFMQFGTSRRAKQGRLLMFAAHSSVTVSESQRESLVQKMQTAIQDKMKEHQAPTTGTLYKLDAAAFASCKLAMVSSAEEALDKGLRELHESKVGLSYMDASQECQVTTTKEQAEALEGVWLTDEDVKMAKEDAKVSARLWGSMTGEDVTMTDDYVEAEGMSMKMMYESRCMDPDRRQKFKAAGLVMP